LKEDGKVTLTSDDYGAWLTNLKAQSQGARARPALSVNAELVRLYHRIGTEILDRQSQQAWGAKVVDRLSRRDVSARSNGQQPADQLPWFHLVVLATKVSDPALREWYATQAIERGWSRATLEASVKSQLHQREGAALTNFERHLPPAQAKLAIEALKDPYHFDFLGVGDEGSGGSSGAVVAESGPIGDATAQLTVP
jgi:hypothetical protein